MSYTRGFFFCVKITDGGINPQSDEFLFHFFSIEIIILFCRPLHLAAPLGMMDVTETLLAKGASVTAVDGRNLSPPLACAPNEDVATCLAMILSVFLATPANSEARRSICSLSKCKIHKELWHEMQTLPNASFLIIIFNFLLQVVRP